MKVGVVGLGKLGLPVALAIEAAEHEVHGWDPDKRVINLLQFRHDLRSLPYVEEDADDLLRQSKMRIIDPTTLAEHCDIIFVAVQTPHQPEFEGVTRLTSDRADFDYTYLRAAVESVADAKQVVVISTVLPGTMEREIHSIIGPDRLLYNPFFIAMGTTIPDFRHPEFVLIGTDGAHPGVLREFYATIHQKPVFVTTTRTAELIKVAYNGFIGMKIAWANTMMEICEKTGADVDDLVDAISLATDRIISPKYLRGGMGDGGGCHPRDLIALSWLAREHNLSYDIFGALMECREKQTEWLAGLIEDEQMSDFYCDDDGDVVTRDIEILGKAYKPETNLAVGSPATLLANILTEQGVMFEHTDPVVDA